MTLLNKLALHRKWLSFPLAVYGAVFLMIVLRGSLMIALGFACAALLAFGDCIADVVTEIGRAPPGRPASQRATDDGILSRAPRARNVCE